MGVRKASATNNKSSKMQMRQSNGRQTAVGMEAHHARCGACRGLVNMTEAIVVWPNAYHRRHAPKESMV